MVETVVADSVAVRAARAPRAETAVSWGAIFGGAVAAAALALILVALGSGVGLSSISAWPGSGASAAAFGMTGAVWLVVTQWLSSAMGGYVAGRLRTKSVGIHTDEVFFRDTAHGFLSWALATLIGFGLIAMMTLWAASETAKNASAVAAGIAGGAAQASAPQSGSATDPTAYLVDTLFRSGNPSTDTDADPRAETIRLLATDLRNGSVPDSDKDYLSTLVAARTGLSQSDAQARVNGVIEKAKAAAENARREADQARKAAADVSFFTAFALLIGAFIGAAGGALGGHQRDEY